jgi:hypothetical protein
MADGKHVGGCIYIHKDYVGDVWGDIDFDIGQLPVTFEYTIIKIDKATCALTFIVCEDFDSADEPTVGESVMVYPSGGVKVIKQPEDPFIYHHKWMMVDRGYEGFDYEASRKRSDAIDSLLSLNLSRIGRKSYWDHILAELRSI